MHTALLLTAALAIAAPVPAAELPPVVVQVKPVGPLLDNLRAIDKAFASLPDDVSFDGAIKRWLGEKGFEGLDLKRPITGYLILPKDIQDLDLFGDKGESNLPLVIVVPVTGESKFLGFLERIERTAVPVPGRKGLYKLPFHAKSAALLASAGGKAESRALRFHNGYAYVTPESHAAVLDDTDRLIPGDRLAMPDEKALLTIRIYAERLSLAVRKQLADKIQNALLKPENSLLPDRVGEVVKKAEALGRQITARYLAKIPDPDLASVTQRLTFNPETLEVGTELVLTPKPGTALAKEFAAREPVTNTFAGLVGKNAIGWLKTSFPPGEPESREILSSLLKEAEKELRDVPEVARPARDAFLKCVTRTIKTENVDVAVALNGPDKDGRHAVVGAFTLAGAADLDKDFRKACDEMVPPAEKARVVLDAAKVGTTAIHVYKPGDQAPPWAQAMSGKDAAVGIALAPTGVYFAYGPDPVAELKAALAQEPREACVFELVMNPTGVRKLAATIDQRATVLADMILDARDTPVPLITMGLAGGKELHVRCGINLRLLFVMSGGRPEPAPAKK
ncbi:hypothetical protein [Fimbriiglobus ruber]|uniref:Uncharacterized protein n=1 Tax=Fimbriiglobus ruber TaxID=1908690 RepID=A0A225DVK6_9BACT|nr:hypothetical protein [Fimbriiglobus ruber]OWK45043.1 hypothetical protein FRUB_01374 [Fimbriiglobus ruber]